jgi:hypothetical protein
VGTLRDASTTYKDVGYNYEMNQDNLKTKVNDRLTQYSQHFDSLELNLKNEIRINSVEFRTKEEVKKIVDQIDNKLSPIIYRFSIESKKQREQLVKVYKEFHGDNREKKRGVDRLNVSRFNDTNNKTLYLGSKMKNPKSRFRQHLGEGHFRTYGLQLNKWDSTLNYELLIEIYEVNTDIDEEYKRSFIELIEQELWEEHLPIFGKKSGL